MSCHYKAGCCWFTKNLLNFGPVQSLANMFALTLVKNGNALQHIMDAVETATVKAINVNTLLTTASIPVQENQATADFIWKKSLFIDNITNTSQLGALNNSTDANSNNSTSSNSSSSSSGLQQAVSEESSLNPVDYYDTDGTFAYVPPMQRSETIFITILFLIIFIVGVLGNGTLVIIFFRHRSMRNIPNTYILSLALADLLVIIVCVPLAILVYTTDSWTFGKSMCQITEFFKDVSIGVSVFTLTALSGERYFAIVNPLRKLQTKPLTVITAAFIWLLSITFATPSLVMSDLQHILIDNTTNLTIIICTPFGQQRNNSEIYGRYVVVTKAFIYYLLPLFIIAVLYLMMAQRLHVSARDMPGETLSMQSRSQVRARRYVARMVVAFVLVFFICFFPYHLFELWFHLNPTAHEDFDEFWHTIRIIGFCTYFLNSCVNPVALYCVSGVFRAHFNQYLCCFCLRRQVRLRQHSTAGGMMDTSIVNMSLRSTNNYNRASVRLNNAGFSSCSTYANGMGRTCNNNHHSTRSRNSPMSFQRNGSHVLTESRGVSIGFDSGRLTSATNAVQSSVVLNDKR